MNLNIKGKNSYNQGCSSKLKVDTIKKRVYFFDILLLKGCENMGRPKGGKNRSWSHEEKLRIVRRYVDEGLKNKKRTGNPFAALHTSKSLTEEERLRLIIARQEVEIERLKKEYFVKGVGPEKEYVITKDVSLKS